MIFILITDDVMSLVELGNGFIRSCLAGRKFSVFSIQTFRKQGKHV